VIMQPFTAGTLGDHWLKLIDSILGTQATTFLQNMYAASHDLGKDVAHVLSLLPGLRCVGIGGSWANSSETWAAIVPSLSVCQDLRLLPGDKLRDHLHGWQGSVEDMRKTLYLEHLLDMQDHEVLCRELRNAQMYA
jgi:hypothetical protein